MCIFPLIVGFGLAFYDYTQNSAGIKEIQPEFLFVGIGLAVFAILFHWLGRAAAKDMEERMATLERKTSPLGKSSSS